MVALRQEYGIVMTAGPNHLSTNMVISFAKITSRIIINANPTSFVMPGFSVKIIKTLIHGISFIAQSPFLCL